MTTTSTTAITIRDGTPRDAPAISRIHVAGWKSRYVDLVPQPTLDALQPADRETRWRGWLSGDDRRTLFVAVDGERVIGFSAGWPEPAGTPGTVEVAAIYVGDEFHGRGLGKGLLTRLAARGRALGFTALSLEMLVGNPTGGFYEHLGGRIVDAYTSMIGGHEIAEVRYRWDDIDVLARIDRGER
jgi:GNAT superfamily N-acetyltransferase